MAFAAILAFIFVLGLSGRKVNRGTYFLIGLAAVVASVYEYLAP
jgi:uncharacterized membrane protein YuzA (DUF378 family)